MGPSSRHHIIISHRSSSTPRPRVPFYGPLWSARLAREFACLIVCCVCVVGVLIQGWMGGAVDRWIEGGLGLVVLVCWERVVVTCVCSLLRRIVPDWGLD
jgi:hypothetical protein